MKKKLFILIFLIFVFLFFGINNSVFAACSFSTDKSSYRIGETAILTYQNVPDSSTLTIVKPDNSIVGPYSLSGNGELSYDILESDPLGSYTITLSGLGCDVSKTVKIAKSCLGQTCPPGAICIPNPLNACSFEDLIDSIIKFIFWLAVALTPLMVLIGAFYILTAAGDPKRVETGQKIILYAVIGLAVILFARGLIAIIKMVLGVIEPE